MATTRGVWVGGAKTPPGYDGIQKDIADVRATVAAVQASMLDFIAKASAQAPTGNTPTLPSNLTELLKRVLPEGGTLGQIPERTASGYTWVDKPTGGGTTTPTQPTTPAAEEDYTAGADAMDESSSYMDAQTATLE